LYLPKQKIDEKEAWIKVVRFLIDDSAKL